MTYLGRINEGKIVLDEKISLPEGSLVRVELVADQPLKSLAEILGDVIGCIDNLPPDMARNHDQYIHNTPK
ncbi:MAG: hypothetical protein IT426_10515 [Pirellulales bacterium]|nr:hypothetical protein [Pirellulales bacterium]